MHLRRAVICAGAFAVALSAGCGERAPTQAKVPGGAGQASSTIEWLAGSVTQTANDPRQVLIDAFERAYPSIKVELVTGPTSTDVERSTLIRELSAGSAIPDVYLGDVVWPYEFGHARLALPLNRYLPASFWSRFGSAAGPRSAGGLVGAATYRGDIYAVPFFVDEGFLFYRKDLLKSAGIARPPATWEELAHDARVLKRKGLTYQFVWQGNDYEGLTCDWIEFLADALGGLPSGQPVGAGLAAELDSPQALKALTFMRSLLADGISPAATASYEETDANNAFDSGQAAFLRGWDSSYADALSQGSAVAGGGKVGVAPLPDFQGQASPGWSVIGGWDLFVNPHTRHLPADLTFITWLAGPQAQRILASQYAEIPANVAVRMDPSVIAENPVLRAAAQTRLVSRPAATTDYQSITAAIHQNIHAALTAPPGGEAPCRALAGAARAVDPEFPAALRCAGGSQSPG